MRNQDYQTIRVEAAGAVVTIRLDRPEVHNAFNADMIRELNAAFEVVRTDSEARVVVFTGRGRSFCAGADLNWMREVIAYSREQNLEESLQIAALLEKIFTLPKPVIAWVNGTAIGGGTGFLSACDIVMAADSARFGLSEVKLGLVPAAISPYVVRRIGEARAREYFLTGERISAARAREIGLVNEVVPADRLEEAVSRTVDRLLTSGPSAIARCKELLLRVPGMPLSEAGEYTARLIADLRVSVEGQEGMAAFLEKRRPRWVKTEKES